MVAGGLAGFQLPLNVPLVTVRVITDVPPPRKLTRLPCGDVVLPLIGRPLLEIVLPDILKSPSVPDVFRICNSNSLLLLIVVFVMLVGRAPDATVPVTSARLIPDSSVAASLPLPVIETLSRTNPFTPEPPIPSPRLLVMFT